MGKNPLKKLTKTVTDVVNPMTQFNMASKALFPEQKLNAPHMPDVPTREDAITGVLTQQLDAIKKKRGGGLGGTTGPSSTSTSTASNSLFGG